MLFLVHAHVLSSAASPSLTTKTKNIYLTSPSLLVLVFSFAISGCGENQIGRPDVDVQMIETDAKPGSSAPHLATDIDGLVVLSWLEPNGLKTALRYSVFERNEWAPSNLVATGANWFVNWADFPSVTPISGSLWAAHWLVRQPAGGYAYDVEIARSTDAGITWSESEKPHHDGTPSEHGFVSLGSYQEEVIAVWLDGREMVGGHHGSGEKTTGGMTLRSASAAMGKPFQKFHVVDDLVCDCCQTDLAIAQSGPILVYRDRTSNEIRDIYVSRLLDGRWEPGRSIFQDKWRIGGCPVNGPAIAAQNGSVVVGWYTEANSTPLVRMIRSDDDGRSFGPPVTIDSDSPVGRVDIDFLESGEAVVSWMGESDPDEGTLLWRVISKEGRLGPLQKVTSISTRRNAGFPQMSRVGNGLLFAWTDTPRGASTIQTARVLFSHEN
ncbi:MAG: sialidase family protein [Pseudomonadota bacterium]|nr:sialidase family protein [Pseudomonadota bacterium]